MAFRIKLWSAVVCAGMAAVLPRAFAQGNLASNSSPSSEATQAAATADDLNKQIKDLLQQCDDEINVHGNFQRAGECAEHARELSRKAGDKSSEAMALVYLGAALGYQGRLNEAYDEGKQTLAVAQESGDKKMLEQALNNLASVAGGLGRYEESVATFYTCLDIAREINDPVMEYMSLLNVGEAYSRSGEPDRAEHPLKEALKLAGELDHGDEKSKARSKKGTEMALLNLAGMESARGRYAAALRYFEEVHASQPSTPLWAISALQGMANSNQLLARPQDAIPLFEQALALAEKSSGGAQIASITSDLGVSQEAIGQLDAALASQYKALNMVHAAGGDRDSEWQIESHIGHVLRAMGRNAEALEHYQASIAGIERLRSVALNSEEGRAGVLAKSHATYSQTADLLVDLHRDADAFAVAERGRARAFLDMLALARGSLPDDLTPEQAKREQVLLASVSSAQKELWKGGVSAKEEQRRKADLNSAEENLGAFRVELRHSNPRYASIRYPEPVDVGQVQSELLDDKTVLAEFLLGDKRSLAWLITRDGLTVASLPPREKIQNEIREYRRLLGDKASVLTLGSSLEKIDLQGAALYRTLLAPIRQAIPAGDALIIVPDGLLNYLPFETLVTGSHRDASGEVWPTYALQKYRFAYAPSASALLAVRTMNSQASHWDKTLLAFGDPLLQPLGKTAPASETVRSSPSAGRTASYDAYLERGFSTARLPFTREEVLSIGRLFPSVQRQLYLGASATEDAVKTEDLSKYRYIHFATHGFLDEAAPDRSGILFSRDPASQQIGVLQAGEIMRLRLDADLVTLSACSTGLGQLVTGEGILGLTRAFFYAGARNLTVSLWNVNDSATSTLMQTFYAQLNHGTSKPEALRRAKLQLLNGPDLAWKNPYFWGAFVLVGDGR
jgi:CHAT domain-containing protein